MEGMRTRKDIEEDVNYEYNPILSPKIKEGLQQTKLGELQVELLLDIREILQPVENHIDHTPE